MKCRNVKCNTDRSQHGYEEVESMGKRERAGSPDWMDTLRSLRDEIRSCKANNERIIREQKRRVEVNVVILQSPSYLQRKKHHEL